MYKLPRRISPGTACHHTADLPVPRRLWSCPTNTAAFFSSCNSYGCSPGHGLLSMSRKYFSISQAFSACFFSVGYIHLCLPSNFLQYFSLVWARVLALFRELPALESFPEKVHQLWLCERVSLGLNLLFLSITNRRGQGVLSSKMNSLFCFALLCFLSCKLETIIKHCHQLFLYLKPNFWQWCFAFLVLSLAYFHPPACKINICNLLVLIYHSWLCA